MQQMKQISNKYWIPDTYLHAEVSETG